MASTPKQLDLNAGYVSALLEQYLENPEAVDPAWRELFESGDDALLAPVPDTAAGEPRVESETPEERGGNGGVALLPAPPRTRAGTRTCIRAGRHGRGR